MSSQGAALTSRLRKVDNSALGFKNNNTDYAAGWCVTERKTQNMSQDEIEKYVKDTVAGSLVDGTDYGNMMTRLDIIINSYPTHTHSHIHTHIHIGSMYHVC